MRLYKNESTRFVVGLIFIIIVYAAFYIFFSENQASKLIPVKTRHLIKFTSTIIVYFIGTIHLRMLKDSWMYTLWHFVHIVGLLILMLMGFVHWYLFEFNAHIKGYAVMVQELLMSPILYVAMGILNKSLKKE